MMAAYIDEHRSRFRVGPICRVLSESLDCGFLTPRGCRMFRTRPVSRMRAGREALARAVLQIRSDFFMAVYGCRKTRARSSAQGRDPAGIDRGWVMDIMREPGVRGVRRGGTSVTARPAKGRGRRAQPRGTRVRGGAPGPAARGRHRLRAHGQRTLRLHGARPPTCSPAGVCDQIKVFGVRW